MCSNISKLCFFLETQSYSWIFFKPNKFCEQRDWILMFQTCFLTLIFVTYLMDWNIIESVKFAYFNQTNIYRDGFGLVAFTHTLKFKYD